MEAYGIKKNKGYTLIEMICVMAILGIICSICYPNLNGFIRGQRLNVCTKMLVNDLRYAKMYAVSKNYPVINVMFIGDVGKEIYSGYKIYVPGSMENATLKEKSFYKEIIVDGGKSTISSGIAQNIIEFHAGGYAYPACTIAVCDTFSGKTKNITLSIGYTRIMEVIK